MVGNIGVGIPNGTSPMIAIPIPAKLQPYESSVVISIRIKGAGNHFGTLKTLTAERSNKLNADSIVVF